MALVVYMPDVPISSARHSPLKELCSSAQSGDDTRQPFWDCLPPDTLALVASHLKPSYIAVARQTCKAWRHGISRGVTTLTPNVQSPAGNRVGSVASYYLYGALRWQDMPQLLVRMPLCAYAPHVAACRSHLPALLLTSPTVKLCAAAVLQHA